MPIQPHPSTRDDPAHRPPEPGACSATASPSSRPPAGPVQPSFGPPRHGSPPNLRTRSGLPGRAGRSTCADATRGCTESTHCTGIRPVLVPQVVSRHPGCQRQLKSDQLAASRAVVSIQLPTTQAAPAGSITVSDGDCQGERTPSRRYARRVGRQFRQQVGRILIDLRAGGPRDRVVRCAHSERPRRLLSFIACPGSAQRGWDRGPNRSARSGAQRRPAPDDSLVLVAQQPIGGKAVRWSGQDVSMDLAALDG